MAVFATLGDLKTHLDITETANDGELTLMLEAAEDVVGSLIGARFPGASVSERVSSVGGTVILSGRPVDDVVLNGGAVTGFFVNRAAGLLHDVPCTSEPLTATYTTGGGGIPASVTLATVIVAGHLWETQRGNTGGGPIAAESDAGFGLTPGAGFAIPNRAKELLAPFARSSQIA